MGTKICPGCGQPRDAETDFSWSIRGVKRHSRCKKCHAEERMDYYERNKEAELAYKWDRQLRKREEARIFVEAYKAAHPCVDCGKRDPRFLTFDHVRGVKKKAISDMVNLGYTIEAIQAELSKCEVRCLECHHLRHH
jgi:hypothetical protein